MQLAESLPGAEGLGRRLARRLGRYTRVGWALADQVLVSAGNFVTVYLFARGMGTAEFGSLMLARTGLLLLVSMQSALLTQPHNVLGAALPGPAYRRFTGALAVAQLLSGGALLLALAAAALALRGFGLPGAGHVLLALAVAAPPCLAQDFIRRVLYTRGASCSAALNDGLTYGLQLGGAFALMSVAPQRTGPAAALLVFGAASLAGAALGALQLRAQVRLRRTGWRAWVRIWARVWDFGKWLTAQNAVVWLGAQGHAWVVGLLLGVEQVGLYRAATHLVNVLNPVRQAAFSYLPARASLAYQSGSASGLARWVRKTGWLLGGVLAPLSLALLVFPRELLQLAYGARYASPRLALILGLSVVAQSVTFWKFPYDLGLLALRQTRAIFYANLVPVALLLTSGVALVHVLGIVGVPISGLLINVSLLAVTWAAYKRRLRQAVRAEHSREGRPDE